MLDKFCKYIMVDLYSLWMVPVDGQMMDMMDSIGSMGSMERVGLMEVSERIEAVYRLFLARFGQIAEKALSSCH